MKIWLLGMGIHAIPAILGLASAYAAQHPLVGMGQELAPLLAIISQQAAMHGLSFLQASYDQATAPVK